MSHVSVCLSVSVCVRVSVCLCVCLLVTLIYCATTAISIEMPLGGVTHVGPRNLVLDGVEISTWKGQFVGVVLPTKKQKVYAAKKEIIQSPITVCSESDRKVLISGTTSFVKILWPLVINLVQSLRLRLCFENWSAFDEFRGKSACAVVPIRLTLVFWATLYNIAIIVRLFWLYFTDHVEFQRTIEQFLRCQVRVDHSFPQHLQLTAASIHRSTQPSTLRGTVKWVPAKGRWCSAAGE